MKAAVASLLLLGFLAPAGARGTVPDPVLWDSPEAFRAEAEAGQFVDRLELHLLQYSADPTWRSEWAARRHTGVGLHGVWGSTTSTELHTDWQVALNLFPAERLQIRYDRREYRDGRFDVADQRLEALWYAGAGWAIALCGWPAADKERSSLGLGLRLGAPRSAAALEIRSIQDRFVWNDKTDGSFRFTRLPLRLVADGYWEGGGFRLRGSVDAMRRWDGEERGGPRAGASARGHRSFADLEAEWRDGAWSGAVRLSGAALLRAQEEGAAAARLERRWARGLVSLRWELDRWSASAIGGWAWQRDEFASPGGAGGTYSSGAALFGLEAGRGLGAGFSARLGYLGSVQRARREVAAVELLAARVEDGFRDKAHLVAQWTAGPGMALELLLSQALRGGAFGGGSVKAIFVH